MFRFLRFLAWVFFSITIFFRWRNYSFMDSIVLSVYLLPSNYPLSPPEASFYPASSAFPSIRLSSKYLNTSFIFSVSDEMGRIWGRVGHAFPGAWRFGAG